VKVIGWLESESAIEPVGAGEDGPFRVLPGTARSPKEATP